MVVLFKLPADPGDRVLQIHVFHIEGLHYYQIHGFGRGYSPQVIVDAHLDIAWGAVSRGHGFLGPPPPGYLISRSTLVAAEVGLIFATLYCAPARAGRAMRTRFVYENAHEANLMATAQVNYYRSCGLELITDAKALATYARGWKKGKVAAVLLMEGADPIETPSQLGAWADRGVRIIGPAWGGTRYAGGTGAPGGLTELGRQLLKAMRRKKDVLDLSHLAGQAEGAAGPLAPAFQQDTGRRNHGQQLAGLTGAKPPLTFPHSRGSTRRSRGMGQLFPIHGEVPGGAGGWGGPRLVPRPASRS